MKQYNQTKDALQDFESYKASTIDNMSNTINTLFKKSIEPNNISEQLLTLKILKG